ncbi:protein takeout-like isoform X2 [Periplaneta americana]|uniref:protein takeout-like isoform X2 n=1 Tax=Periplaneta americana TaxID=6978 RepID=UPI0037E7B031
MSQQYVSLICLPPYLKVCHRSDSRLQECLKNSINNVLRNIKNGSTELGLKSLDPLDVPFLEMTQDNGNATIHIEFKNVRFEGLSNTNVTSVKANIEEHKLEITSRLPYLDIMGNFNAEGGVLSFPISAQGVFHVNTTDVIVVLIVYYVPSNLYLAVERLTIDLIPSGITYDFDKYLDGDNKLGEAMNVFLNENSHEVFSAMKPQIVDMFSQVMTDVSDKVLHNFPADILLPE